MYVYISCGSGPAVQQSQLAWTMYKNLHNLWRVFGVVIALISIVEGIIIIFLKGTSERWNSKVGNKQSNLPYWQSLIWRIQWLHLYGIEHISTKSALMYSWIEPVPVELSYLMAGFEHRLYNAIIATWLSVKSLLNQVEGLTIYILVFVAWLVLSYYLSTL